MRPKKALLTRARTLTDIEVITRQVRAVDLLNIPPDGLG